jgi:glycosyltransferase involved in cell wall biosynthesis
MSGGQAIPRLSVVVPATDAPATLARCRSAIEAQLAADDELIVVSDGEATGPAAARNAGAREATGDVLLFVDADVVVHEDALARVRAAFGADRGLGGLFGSYDDSPGDDGTISSFRNLLHHHVHQSAPGVASTFWAGIGAVRRELFDSVGGFDERAYRHASIEDIELGMRLSAAGARIVLDPEVQGTHLKRWTLPEMVYTDLARRGAPWVALLIQEGWTGWANGSAPEARRALNLGWRHRASAAASLAIALALVRRRPAAAGLSAAALVALNASFYRLLLRRRGSRDAAAGVALHTVHHLTAVASVPAGIIGRGSAAAPVPARTPR